MSKFGFSPEFMEQLKAKNDLVEFASLYLSLDKRGYNYWACCPFHHEKTPSFSINAAEGYYHCFGCGVSGDVIGLAMEMESLPFPEAVKFLAARAKIPLPEMNYDNERTLELKRKKDRVLKVLLSSARFYLSNLYSGKADQHLEYIEKRKLSPSTVKKFGMGASLDYRSLPDFLRDSGFTQEEILESGVCTLTDRGTLIDSLANRLIIPIINSMDEVIAFGGRILGQKTDRVAKYKNTKETIVFNKRKTLYNINLLKKHKQNNAMPYVIMVEGYMDTISLYQAGFYNVVASMGTSLTPDQARLLKRYCNNVMISYDQDGAGQSADLRGLEILKQENLNVKVVLMPEGEDPDDVCRKRGHEGYQNCLDNALPLIDYKLHALEKKYDLSLTDDKRAFVQAAIPIVRESPSAAEQEDLLKIIRDKTGFTYQALQSDLEHLKVGHAPVVKPNTEREKGHKVEKSDRVKKAGRFIIGAVLFNLPYAEKYVLQEENFADEVHHTIVVYIKDCKAKGIKVRVTDLFELFGENEAEFNEILDLNTDDRLYGERAEQYFSDCIRTVEMNRLQEEITSLKMQIGGAQDSAVRRELTLRLAALTQALKNYR